MVHWGIGLNFRQTGVVWFGTPSTLKVRVSVRLYKKFYVLVRICTIYQFLDDHIFHYIMRIIVSYVDIVRTTIFGSSNFSLNYIL